MAQSADVDATSGGGAIYEFPEAVGTAEGRSRGQWLSAWSISASPVRASRLNAASYPDRALLGAWVNVILHDNSSRVFRHGDHVHNWRRNQL